MSKQYVIRTASIQHVDQIEGLYRSKQSRHFGEKLTPPLTQLFSEYQSHRLAIYERGKESILVAYCEFCIYPNIKVLANHLWSSWLNARFCLEMEVTAINTIFFNFAIHHETHPNTLKEVIYDIFHRELRVTNMIIPKPPIYDKGEYELIEKYGTTYYPKDFKTINYRNSPSIIVIERKKIMPNISFRKALPEDNDDIVNIIDFEEPHLRHEYGDYYMAELLLGTNGRLGTSKIIVAEITDEVTEEVSNTGVMWLTDNLDLELLLKNFNFEGVGNLVHCTPDAKHSVVTFDVECAEPRRYTALYTDRGIDKLKTVGGLAGDLSKYSMLGKFSSPHKGLGELSRESFIEREFVFAKFMNIYEELRNGSHYINRVKKNLVVVFDTGSNLDYSEVSEENILGTFQIKETRTSTMKSLNRAANAFLLKKFNLHPKQPVEYVFSFLIAMFSAYPQHDYCIVSVPAIVNLPKSIRHLLKYFMRINHRPSTSTSEEIFVCHRSTLFGMLNLYKLEESDMPTVRNMLLQDRRTDDPERTGSISEETVKKEEKRDEIIDEIFNDLMNNFETELIGLTFSCGQMNISCKQTTMVGFAVLRPFTDYNYLNKLFFLPPDSHNLYHRRGEIILLKLHPFFHMWSDELIRALAIKSGFRELFYINHFMGTNFPNDIMRNMMPVEPRRKKRNWFISGEWGFRRRSKTINFPIINLCRDRLYVYWHNLQPSMHLGPQETLVIIGFSDICRAFLRHLIFGWNTKDFTFVKKHNCLPHVDITVIVEYGIVEAAYDCQFDCKYCEHSSNCYVSRFNVAPFVRDTTHRMDLRHYVHFVMGKVTYIDRENNEIGLNNNCKINYSTLLLMCDERHGLSNYDNIELPYNYAQINFRLDKIILYHKIQEMSGNKFPSKKILVYGGILLVYECINFLLKHGCEPQDLVLVQPHLVEMPEILNNPNVDSKLDFILVQMVEDLGIEFHSSCNYVECILYENENFIDKVKFKRFPSGEILEVFCDLFINYNENFLDLGMEKVLRSSGIEFDDHRQILVNENYCTNDPNIYALGKYITIIPEPNYQYIHISYEELAEKIIYILKLDPNGSSEIEPRFSAPCFFVALLPFNYKIIKVTVPKRYVIGQLPNEYNETLTTYENNEFCRVRLTTTGMVTEITCVTNNFKNKFYFIEYFCGKHEALLNNLKNRWKLGLITNFITFFQQPWTELYMHRCFIDLQAENHKALMPLVKKVSPATALNNVRYRERYQSIYQPILEHNVVNFLRKYRGEFINEFALPEDSGWPFI